MKKHKKSKTILPQVHILGDLQDVANLVAAVNKKKAIVLFHDAEQDVFYLEIAGEIQEIRQKDISRLEKDYKLILFSFFPSRKKVEPASEEAAIVEEEGAPAVDLPVKAKKKEKAVQKEKKEKKSPKEQPISKD